MRMAPLITSLQNSRLKALAKLHDAKYRKREQRVLIDGQREIRQAIAGGVVVEEIWFDPERLDVDSWYDNFERKALANANIQPANAEVLQKLQYGDRNEGLVAVARTPQWNWSDLSGCAKPLIVILDRIEKPGNIGAVCRTAVAAGVNAVVLSDCPGEAYNPNAIRSSLGLIFRIPILVATAAQVANALKQLEVPIYVARVQATKQPYQIDFKQGAAIVLGSEAEGLQGIWLEGGLHGVRIPMDERVDSLNVSVSAAILMYEAVRQRGQN
jgi:TrmH family RNA methyltransferase